MAKLIKTDGTEIFVEPKNGKCFELAELQDFVGGDIEIVHLFDDPLERILIINESGKLEDLKMNHKATNLFTAYNEWVWDYIAGDALLCLSTEIE